MKDQKRSCFSWRSLVPLVFMVVGLLLIVGHYTHAVDRFIYPAVVSKAHESTKGMTSKEIYENIARINKRLNVSASGSASGEIPEGSFEGVSSDPNISYDPNLTNRIDHVPFGASVNRDYMVGRIYIPDLGVNLPILEGTADSTLYVAGGTMKPNQQMGKRNYALAGHHMPNPAMLFTPIMYAQNGQSIFLTDYGKVYEYKVTDTFDVPPSEGYVMYDSEGDKIITLVTCTDIYGTARHIVRGKLVGVKPFDGAPRYVQDAMTV